MITAIDTNVLLDILLPNKAFYDATAFAMQRSGDQGSLLLSDIVHAELCAHFETQRACDSFLLGNGIRLQALLDGGALLS